MEKKLKQAIYEDFKELLVEEFTIDWEAKRFLIELYLEAMSLDNTIKFIKELNEVNYENDN